jgi:autotransporter-associated beta strand protein
MFCRRASSVPIISILCVWMTLAYCPSPAWSVDIGAVMPAALDQPRINILFKTTPNGAPITDSFGLGWFMDDPYLDTGASGIMLSQLTSMIFNLDTKLARYPDGTGPLVVYQDVGVGGTQDFNVSTPLYIGIAKYHPDVDGTSALPFNQTTGSVRLQMTPEDNPDIGPLDVVGMPAMIGKVVVMDPKPADNLFDTMQTYIYNPGTPFNPAAANTEPGIPATNHHVKLSYASFDQFTNLTPAGAPGPTLAASPFIGPNPVTGGSADTPGVTVEFGGLKTTGSFLFDSGASTSMISSSLAEKLHVRYRPGTEGTAVPILERLDPASSQWTEIADQFTLPVGGVGGIVTAAGFFLDDMLIRTIEGNAANDQDPNHLKFLSTPVLVNDITLRDPKTNQMLTLDGVFGMNNVVANAMIIPGDPIPSIFGQTLSNFNWAVFDQPNGLLGLDVKPPISGWTGNGSSDLYQEVYQSTDNSWSNSYNWEGVSPGSNSEGITLVFSRSTPASTSNFNDFPAGTPFKGITFSGAAVFTLQGNRIALVGDVINNSTATQTINLDLELRGANRTFAANTRDIIVSGQISGDQGLVKTGANKLVLKAANTYAGKTTVSEGTLTLDGGDLADVSGVSIADGATLEVISGTPTLGNINGRGAVSVSGSGTILTASSISAGTLRIGTVASSAWTGGGNPADSHWSNPLNWGGTAPKKYGVLNFGESTPASVANANDYGVDTPFYGIVFSGSSAFTLQGNRIRLDGNVVNSSSQPQTIELDVQLIGMSRSFSADTADIVVSGHVSGSEGLIKTGTANLILQSANTYTGDTAIREGTLILDGGDLADASTVNIAADAALEVISGTPTLGSITGQGAITATGAGTVLSAHSITADRLTIGSVSAMAVPEPSAIVLLCLGLVVAVLYRTRKC